MHAFFRILGFNLISSLELATLSVILLANIGWLYLAKGFLRNKVLQYLFVLTISSSSTYIGHVYLKPNAASYGLVSWLLLILLKLSNFRNQSKVQNSVYLGISILLPAIYALNVWYVAYFVSIFLSLSLIIFVVVVLATNNLTKFISLKNDFTNHLNLKIVLSFLISSGSLYGLFFATYYPELKNGYGETNKQLLLDNSPNLVALFDSSAFGGGIFSNLYLNYISVESNSIELNLGITAFILIPFIIITLISLKSLFNLNNSLANIFHFSLLLSSLILLISIIKLTPDLSIFSFLWDNIFLLRTMRVPVRLIIVFTFIALIYIFKYLDRQNQLSSRNTKYFIYLYLIILVLDQHRTPTIFWSQNELVDQQTLAFSEEIKDCPAFVINREEVGWWKDTIDAMILSNLTGVPTVNGFSSNNPKYFPSISWTGNESLEPIIEWLERNNNISDVCLITQNSSVTRLPVEGVRLFLNQGFVFPKSNDEVSQIQISSSNAKISIQNFSNTASTVDLSLKISKLSCIQNQKVRLLINDEFDLNVDLGVSIETVTISMLIPQWEHKILNLILSDNYCENKDNERIYLNLNDFKVSSRS